MAKERDIPYCNFNFEVDLGGGITAGFSDVSGLGGEMVLAEYRNGNAATNYVTKIPGMNKASDVNFKRGVIGSTDIFTWFKQARAGDLKAKRDVIVKLKNEDPSSESAVISYTLKNAMPLKWVGPNLAAKGGSGEVAMEELTIACESIDIT